MQATHPPYLTEGIAFDGSLVCPETPPGEEFDVLSSINEVTLKIVVDIQEGARGIILESGGSGGKGIRIYLGGGNLYVEVAEGKANRTGPTGLDRSNRGYIETPVASGIAVIEVTARDSTDDLRLYINGEFIGEDPDYTNPDGDLSGAEGGAVGRHSGDIAATQLEPSRGDVAIPRVNFTPISVDYLIEYIP